MFHSPRYTAVTSRGWLELTSRLTPGGDTLTIDIAAGTDAPIRLVTEFITPEEFAPKRDNTVMYLDAEALTGSPVWELRRWRHGDRMTPFGMKGSRKLSDMFSDAGHVGHRQATAMDTHPQRSDRVDTRIACLGNVSCDRNHTLHHENHL